MEQSVLFIVLLCYSIKYGLCQLHCCNKIWERVGFSFCFNSFGLAGKWIGLIVVVVVDDMRRRYTNQPWCLYLVIGYNWNMTKEIVPWCDNTKMHNKQYRKFALIAELNNVIFFWFLYTKRKKKQQKKSFTDLVFYLVENKRMKKIKGEWFPCLLD